MNRGGEHQDAAQGKGKTTVYLKGLQRTELVLELAWFNRVKMTLDESKKAVQVIF